MKYAFFDYASIVDEVFVPTVFPGGYWRVSEVVEAPVIYSGVTFQFEEMYHPSLVKAALPCGDDVGPNWRYDPETGEYAPPPAPPVEDEPFTVNDTGNGEPPPKP